MNWLADPENLRMAVFLGLLLALLMLERRWPRRAEPMRRALRWPSNFGLVLIGTALLALMPLAALGVAHAAETAGIGLFNQTGLPAGLDVALAWLLLDLAIYLQHRAMHEVPLLWRLHRVHHSDIEFDVTTGLRFHPLELLLSMAWKMLVIVLLGAPWLAVLLLELTLSSFALWSHANLRYPASLERRLRRLFITPEVHRIHHSPRREETNSNYGSALLLWDHLFRSFTAHPRDGHERMQIGLTEFRTESEQHLPQLLQQPVRQ